MTPRHKTFSPARIYAITVNTLLELVRLKVFYFVLIFAMLIIGSSLITADFTFQEQFQSLKAVSLGAMTIFAFLLAVLASSILIPNDVEDRTLYTILAKPVPRFEYLLGKLFGVLALLLVATLVMAALFAVVLYTRQQNVIAQELARAQGAPPETVAAIIEGVKANTFNWNLLPGVAIIYLKAAVFAALTLLVSTFASSSIFTVIVVVIIYVIGHVQGTARDYWLAGGEGSPIAKIFLGAIALLFPDLQLFNLADDIVAGNAVALGLFLKTAGWGCAYLVVYTLVAQFIFSAKEL